jgi:hypothetical protein
MNKFTSASKFSYLDEDICLRPKLGNHIQEVCAIALWNSLSLGRWGVAVLTWTAV